MRGEDKGTGELFSYVDLEKRVRSDHPLRAIRGLVRLSGLLNLRRSGQAKRVTVPCAAQWVDIGRAVTMRCILTSS